MSGNSLNSIPILIITLVVGFIMVVTAVIPLASDYSDAKTFNNEGSFDVKYTQSESLTLIWDHSEPKQVKVNDAPVSLPVLSNGDQRTILCGDGWIIRAGYGDSLGGYYVQWYAGSGANILASQANGYDLTANCESGTINVSDTQSTPSTATSTYTYLYCISDNGDYVMKNPNDTVFMKGDSVFYAMGLTNVGSYTSTGIKIRGTIDDGAEWSIFRGNPDNFTFSNQEINYSEVSGYTDLYKLESLTATVSAGGNDVDAVYSFFIVPAKVTADPDNPDTFKNMIRIVPLIALVALIAAAAGMIYFKGKE